MAELAFVALGSNMGDRAAYLATARATLANLPLSRLVASSRVEETAPFGPVPQAPYLNQMVAISTGIPAALLLTELQRIERSLGRVRATRWGPRTIDLDLVRYGDQVIDLPALTLPHPGLASRDFWQREMAELSSRLEQVA